MPTPCTSTFAASNKRSIQLASSGRIPGSSGGGLGENAQTLARPNPGGASLFGHATDTDVGRSPIRDLIRSLMMVERSIAKTSRSAEATDCQTKNKRHHSPEPVPNSNCGALLVDSHAGKTLKDSSRFKPDICVTCTTTAIKLNSDPDPISAPIFAPAIAAMATTITTSQQHSEYTTSNFRHARIQQTRIFDASIPSGRLPKCMKSDRVNEQNGTSEKSRSNPRDSNGSSASTIQPMAGLVIISGASAFIKYRGGDAS